MNFKDDDGHSIIESLVCISLIILFTLSIELTFKNFVFDVISRSDIEQAQLINSYSLIKTNDLNVHQYTTISNTNLQLVTNISSHNFKFTNGIQYVK